MRLILSIRPGRKVQLLEQEGVHAISLQQERQGDSHAIENKKVFMSEVINKSDKEIQYQL